MGLTWFQKVFRQEYAGWKPPQVPLLGPVGDRAHGLSGRGAENGDTGRTGCRRGQGITGR
jgi:hypothetical protein